MLQLATADSTAAAAATIGAACSKRAIMTAGIVIGNGQNQATVSVLRPFARVLRAAVGRLRRDTL